jgi:membrane protease YdiL (CAAX protease family)
MIAYLATTLAMLAIAAVIILLNERLGLLRCDHFPNTAAKLFAYVWLALFFVVIGFVIAFSAKHVPTSEQLARVPFYSLFELHAILVVFLLGWWLASGRPPLRTFLNIQREHQGEAVLTGLAVGLGGWIFTILIALMIALILRAAGLMPNNMQPSPMIGFLAKVAWWKKVLIVLSAMTIEEALFRGFLQKRLGLVASTLLFAMAHSGLGQPFLLIGVAIISLVIGFTFYRTKNLIPGVIAHGVFDAVQLFVIIPIAFKVTGV